MEALVMNWYIASLNAKASAEFEFVFDSSSSNKKLCSIYGQKNPHFVVFAILTVVVLIQVLYFLYS